MGDNSLNAYPLPIGVENHCGVTTEKRDSLWKLASFLERDDSECTTTTSFPIDCKVFRVDLICVLCQIGDRCGERSGAVG
jgi:hypothetical protein